MKKLKGFTLLELIIVMAIFSIIMYSAVQLLDPVAKFYVRSSNFENTTACTDNMRRCIEGNLKYADRIRAYSQFTPYTYDETDYKKAGAFQSVTLSNDLLQQVQDFYTLFFEGRSFLDISGNIYVLVFDNTETVNDTELATLSKLSDFTGNMLNRGKLVLITFPFDVTSGMTPTDLTQPTNYTVQLWNVNQKLYGNFDYHFAMNSMNSTAIDNARNNLLIATSATTSATTATDVNGSVITAPPVFSPNIEVFNPQDFAISITSNEIRRTAHGLTRRDTGTASVASFSMKNVLNAADGYRTASYDYKTVMVGNEASWHSFATNPNAGGNIIPRYAELNTYTGATPFDGFYFIFTNPDNIRDVPDIDPNFDPNTDPRFSMQNVFSNTVVTP